MTVASLVAAQRTEHDVCHAVSCRALGLSESWLYKWLSRGPSDQELRRRCLDEAVKASFDDSGGTPGDIWVAESVRRPHRGGLEGVGEHGGGFDGPPRPGCPQPQA